MHQPKEEDMYTHEAFWKLVESDPDHKYELIDGQPVMMTGGSNAHEAIIFTLAAILRLYLQKIGCRGYNEAHIVLKDEKQLPCADLLVSCNEEKKKRGIRSPRLIFEVLSKSTALRDRNQKANLYRTIPTLQEYVLVESRYPLIEVQRRDPNHHNLWHILAFYPSDVLELTSINLKVAVDEIYDDLDLDSEEEM
jgi:Uma2 family endonuclease